MIANHDYYMAEPASQIFTVQAPTDFLHNIPATYYQPLSSSSTNHLFQGMAPYNPSYAIFQSNELWKNYVKKNENHLLKPVEEIADEEYNLNTNLINTSLNAQTNNTTDSQHYKIPDLNSNQFYDSFDEELLTELRNFHFTSNNFQPIGTSAFESIVHIPEQKESDYFVTPKDKDMEKSSEETDQLLLQQDSSSKAPLRILVFDDQE